MRITAAVNAPFDQVAYTLDVNVFEGLESVVQVQLPGVMNNNVNCGSQSFEQRVWKAELLFSLVKFRELYSRQVDLEAELCKAFLLSFSAVDGTIQTVDLFDTRIVQ